MWKTGADVLLGEANLNVQQLVKSAELAQDGLKAVAAMQTQLASSALGIINVSSGYSEVHSESESTSTSKSTSSSQSSTSSYAVSHNHQYNER